jgi:hypothetical protein
MSDVGSSGGQEAPPRPVQSLQTRSAETLLINNHRGLLPVEGVGLRQPLGIP